jgi:hypothetical protein
MEITERILNKMSEQIRLEISLASGGDPLITLYGDFTEQDYPKWKLTGLDGWDAPITRNTITVADPNGGSYADPYSTKQSKVIAVNWSIFHKNDFASWEALQTVTNLSEQDDTFFTLKVVRKFDSGDEVQEVLKNCYFVNEPVTEKKPGEYRYTVSFGSTEYALETTVVGVLPDLHAGELIGGPWNGYYTLNDDDPRNFNGPRFKVERDTNNPDNFIYDPTYNYVDQLKEKIGGPYNGPYTDDPYDPRNFASPNYWENGDPNNPTSYAPDPKYIWFAKLREYIGGPFNAPYTHHPYDPRNFESPYYYIDQDPNNPANPNYDPNYGQVNKFNY